MTSRRGQAGGPAQLRADELREQLQSQHEHLVRDVVAHHVPATPDLRALLRDIGDLVHSYQRQLRDVSRELDDHVAAGGLAGLVPDVTELQTWIPAVKAAVITADEQTLGAARAALAAHRRRRP